MARAARIENVMNEKVLAHLRANTERHVKDLRTFVRKPSVASHNRGMRECVTWLAEFMSQIGISPMVIEDANFPVLMAEVKGSTSRSLLVYGHYDVQPADESEWEHDPFGAEIVGGRMYGRGTVDDKGQVMAVLEAMRAYLECGLRLPVTVKLLLEGEEEVGSPSLRPVLLAHHDFLKSDALVNFDDSVWFDGRPRVVCGLKGVCKLRLEARTPREFHAMMSPLIPGAVWRLTWALNSLVAPDGRILVRNFYDDVLPPQQKDLDVLVGLGWTGKDLLRESGQISFLGDKEELDALSAFILEPTCNLQGFSGGYVTPNQKGVVPAFAAAELRFGLVPDQTPEGVYERVCDHLAKGGFDDIEVELIGRNPWARTPIDSEIAQALARSLDAAFGRGVAFQPSYAGSGPEGTFQELFPSMQQAYSGFGPVESNIHAPNEYIVVDDYLKGIETVARLYDEYAGG